MTSHHPHQLRAGSTPASHAMAGQHGHPPSHSHSYSTPPIHAAYTSPDPTTGGSYRSYGAQEDRLAAQQAVPQRTYDSTPSQHSAPHPAYPPSPPQTGSNPWDPQPMVSWAIPPSGPQTTWLDTMRPPSPTPYTRLPALDSRGIPVTDPPQPIEKDTASAKPPIISRLRDKLVGGRFTLSRTWEKASFTEECQSAPAAMGSMTSAQHGGRMSDPAAEMGAHQNDSEMGIGGGKKREKKTVVNRAAGMADGAFSPSGRPTSLYASPAALRAFKPLPINGALPDTPSDPPRGLTSA